MAIAFTAAHAAVIQIYNVPALAQADPNALNRQWVACRRAMSAVKEVNTLGAEYFPLGLGVTLPPVYKFLVSETRREDIEHDIDHINEDIHILLRTFDRVKGFMALESEAGLDYLWYTPTSA